MNNRFLVIFLIFCFLAPIKATLILLRNHKYESQLELLSNIDSDELVLLEFSSKEAKTELDWKNGHEFEYNGLMYDVVETKTEGSITYYYAKPDHKETKFNKRVAQLLEVALRNSNPNKGYQKRVNNAKEITYYSSYLILQYPPIRTLPRVNNYIFNYLSVSFPPPTPPPKVVHLATLA